MARRGGRRNARRPFGTVWPRTSPEGKPAVYVTRDAGKTWKRRDRGLPRSQAWFTVKRQCMTADDLDPVGLYFGTTSGDVWHSGDEGKSWGQIAQHLPHIYSVTVARV
ncbi:MAG: beta propeller repeat protein [Candidatus Xenobia bacterium]